MPDVERSALEMDSLRDEVKKLGDEVRQLKEQKAEASLIKEKVARMLEKKKLLGEEASGKFVVKFPKGTRDFGPKAAAIRDGVLQTITECFLVHCAQKLDTPVYELREVLLGKYGEEGGKLIFDLADEGMAESLSLRYDLTVPFARYLALTNTSHIKRYHIGKVYRRDQPVMTRGRYREFYQCDFDIAGQCRVPMEPEAEVLKLVDEILSKLGLGDFEIKLNHRALLEGMFEVCGIGTDLFKTVCSSIDKLDKVPWEEVRLELVNEKHVNHEAVNKLERLVRMREQNKDLSNLELLQKFATDPSLTSCERIQTAVADLRILLDNCASFGVDHRIAFEPALARGLDYYTGAIFETVYKEFSVNLGEVTSEGDNEGKTQVGTVAAGGRYDNLVELFSATKMHVPCVGISFGVERLFSIMELRAEVDKSNVRTSSTEVYVASAQKNLLDKRMELCKNLWDERVKFLDQKLRFTLKKFFLRWKMPAKGDLERLQAEMAYKANPKMLNQLQYCEERLIPVVAIVGQREIEEGVVKLRDVVSREEKDIPKAELTGELKSRLPGLKTVSDLNSCTLNERVSRTVTESFKRHGAETIDTPVFELREVLLGKYGSEDEKSIVEMKDQGGELSSMRYDLTVPFARYLSMNKMSNMKRYLIGKVYRKNRAGACKEIQQCDFDIAGQYDAMLADSECLRIVEEILVELGLANFEIRLNHCGLLQGFLAVCGIKSKYTKAALACLRRLNESGWDEVRRELSQKIRLEQDSLDKLERFIRLHGSDKGLTNLEFLDSIDKDGELMKKAEVKAAVSDLRLLLRYSELYGCNDRVVFDPSLVPWFDYYTGMVFNVVFKGSNGENNEKSTVIAKGGRYDDLVGLFMSKNQRVPCVGLSLEMDRLVDLVVAKAKADNSIHCSLGVEVFLATAGNDLASRRQKLLCDLWKNGIKTEMFSEAESQEGELKFCEKYSVPLFLVLVDEKTVRIRNVRSKVEKDVPWSGMIPEVVELLKQLRCG